MLDYAYICVRKAIFYALFNYLDAVKIELKGALLGFSIGIITKRNLIFASDKRKFGAIHRNGYSLSLGNAWISSFVFSPWHNS
ncbi:hypothetical protein, partial [Prevotella bivia]|uniref:hypothetical protein n=1 Tax=Prevotella bivia TaxID=28125 RepID=UPI0006613684